MILYFQSTLHSVEVVLKEKCTRRASLSLTLGRQSFFQLVHSDLKEFSIESYSKYKYIITFLDDYSSHAWI